MSSSSSKSKRQSSPELLGDAACNRGSEMQAADNLGPHPRLRQRSAVPTRAVLPQPHPQQPVQYCNPATATPDSNNEFEADEKRLRKEPGRLKLRRRFRKRRSDSPLDSSNPSESRTSMSGRAVKFHRLFDIPTSEVLIRTFPCALKAEILLQGTFYVSANYFGFYARLANKRKTIKIPIRTVCEITREKTAIFFPNAIGIRTEECRYVFGSILSREATVKLLLDLWKAALSHVENGTQPAEQTLETVRRIFRSSSDSDLASLQSGAPVLVKQKNHQNGDCPALVVSNAAHHHRHLHSNQLLQASNAASPSIVSSSAPASQLEQLRHLQQPHVGGDAGVATGAATNNRWSEFFLQVILFLKSYLSFILADNRMAIGCSLIVFCLIYVLYLAYQIHMIQQTISERLEELLQSSAILSPLVNR